MKITLMVIGKTDNSYLKEGISVYEKRLRRYIQFELKILPDIKNTKSLSELEQKNKEGQLILGNIKNSDFVVLLDDKGKEFSSIQFSENLQKHMNSGVKNLVLLVGGPYGFSQEVRKRGNSLLSLSRMTFSHQMVRLIFVEQLYRAMTILKGEPYHHE